MVPLQEAKMNQKTVKKIGVPGGIFFAHRDRGLQHM